MAFINTVVARAAASIWGLKLGYATTEAVLAQATAAGGNLDGIINEAFNLSYGNVATSTVAAMVVGNLGLTGAAATAGTQAIVDLLAGVANEARGAAIADIVNLFAGLTADPTYGAAAAAFNTKVAGAVAYSGTVGSVDAVLGNLPSATSFMLGTGRDNITATAGNDTFWAYIENNANTLQSGDWMDGGAGVDTLYADMGSSQNFAVTPQTTNVETIVIRGQSRATDTGDNNVAGQGRVLIDAQRISGETRYESNNSRADVMIEDVRILPTQITKDITIAFTESDPGNVDFGVYFDQHSLTANRTTSSQLVLEVLDTRSTAQGLDPLLRSPYDGVSFSLSGVTVSLRDTATNTAIQDATTFAALLAAIQAAIARTPEAAGVTAALGPTFTVLDSLGTPVSGTQIILTASGRTFAPGNWIASAGVPADSSLHTAQIAGSTSTEDLVTSTVILDDVGRGSNGGDLVIGGLSTGVTSTSKGVDRFEITVERTSKLATINSTNNWLKEVTFRNGAVNGDVQVFGNSHAAGGGGSLNPGHTEQLPGAEGQHNQWGFSDVRLIDASAMSGRVMFDAEVTPASFAKYIRLTDTQSDPAGDNTSLAGKTTQVADFIYSGGSNNDTINVLIDGGIVASNSSVQPGREDFTFVVNGNGGNDSLTVRVVDQANDGLNGGVADNWYMHQKTLRNVTIDAGDGNDTVRTPGAGDVTIRLGAGADTVYADNTGAQVVGAFGTGAITNTNSSGVATGQRGVWVFGTADQTGAALPAARNLNDIRSDLTNNNYGNDPGVPGTESLYRATVTVNFMGLTASVQLPVGLYRPTDLHVNQAIKAAINNDAVLNKLLIAEDGPLYSLVVKSLIDGVMVTADLAVTLTAYTVTTGLTLQDERNAYAALNPSDTTPTDVELQALLNAAKVLFDTKGDYVARFANNGATDIIGANSITPSDNTITPGSGNDVIVLGSTSAAAADESSNDTVVFTSGFENDVIVYFQTGALATGGDILNLTAIGGSVGGNGAKLDVAPAAPGAGTILFATATTDGMVHIHNQTPATDTATEIAALYTDSGATTGSTKTSVYIAVDTTTNRGLVYTVSDPVGAANVSATLVGTIDIADTDWLTFTVANFT